MYIEVINLMKVAHLENLEHSIFLHFDDFPTESGGNILGAFLEGKAVVSGVDWFPDDHQITWFVPHQPTQHFLFPKEDVAALTDTGSRFHSVSCHDFRGVVCHVLSHCFVELVGVVLEI